MNEAPVGDQPTTAIESIADLSKLVGAPARPATEVRILQDGADAFPAMFELIDAAQSEENGLPTRCPLRRGEALTSAFCTTRSGR